MVLTVPPCDICHRPIPKGKEKVEVLDKPKLVEPATARTPAKWKTIEYYHEECAPPPEERKN